MFKNIKTLKFNFDVELNESEINQKIHLPKLKELEIKKISLLNYFTGLRSLKIIEITWLDVIDYQMINTVMDPAKLFYLSIIMDEKVEDRFLNLFTNLRTLTLSNI